MPKGTSPGAVAIRLLRLLLPLCLVAATIVAVQGLFRVVGEPAASPVSHDSASLRLGAGTAGDTAAGAAPVMIHPTPLPVRSKAPTAEPTAEPLTTSVVVINASGITGLAGRTAAVLRERGVNVAAIGNLSPARRPITRTVFYPPGGLGQAQTLAGLSHAPAVAPAPQWLQPGGKLVLVIPDANQP